MMHVSCRFFAAVSIAIVVNVASAAVTYVNPWYVNPTLRLRIDNDLASGVKPCSVDAVGEWFVMANDAADATNLRTISADTVFSRDVTADDVKYGADPGFHRFADGTLTNRFTHSGTGKSTDYGLSSAPLVAVDPGNGRFLAANPDLSALRLFNLNRDKWGVGAGAANAPTAIIASGLDATDCFAFCPDGVTLLSNHAAGESRGTLAKSALSGTTLAKTGDLATGLSVVKRFCVASIDGVDYAVAGEGSAAGDVQTKGRIVLVKVSDGTATTLIDDPTHLTGGIVSVRMSHADEFRPRIYALLDSGDVVCYYYRKDKGTCHWTATFTNEKLLAVCKSPYAASVAKVTQFAVSGNGEAALVGYAPNDGVAAQGKPSFAFLYHTATPWTYYAAGATGNPCQTGGACITDGNWVLTMESTTKIGASNTSGAAYGGSDYMGEVLDLSAGTATDSANAATKYKLNMNNNLALGTNATCRGPRVLLIPSKQTDWCQFTKGWWGDGNYEEVVIGFSDCEGWNPWAGFAANVRRVVVDSPKMTQIKDTSLYGNNCIFWGDLSRWEDFNFPAVYTFGLSAAGYCLATGKLTLPSAKTIGQEAFFAAHNMTELSLAADAKCLSSVGYRAFGLVDGKAGSLRRVVLGCASGCTFASQVFYKQPLEEIVLTGAMPTISGSSGWDRWSDEKEKQLTFVIPRNATWEALIKDKWTPLTDAERQAFHVAHPGRYVPFGLLETSALGSFCRQYVAYLDDTGYCRLKVERDDFFADDAVTVAADHEPASDGTYLKGTKVSLTAAPGATGTFHKWYGGPFAGTDGAAKNSAITVTLDEDTWLYCRIVHPWTLSSDKKTLSNGNFTLNCSVNNNEGKRTLSVATTSRWGLYAANDTGYGVCDMGGDVLLAGDSSPWAITGWNISGGSLCGERGGKGNARALLAPLTAESMPGSQCFHCTSGFWHGRSYETVVIDCPKATGMLYGGWWTCGQYRLHHFVLQAPKFSGFSGDAFFWNAPMAETKIDWWNLSSVSSISARALAGYDWNRYWSLATGALRLPSLRTTVRDNNGWTSLCRNKCVTNFFIGGANKAATVTELVANSFNGSTALETITIHNDPAMSVGATPFAGCTALKEIVLTGKAFTSETPFSKLLESVTAATTKPMKVYVSKYKGWNSLSAWLDAPTEAERAEAPGETVLGVYRGGATAPSGKALVLHRDSPFDPNGLAVIVR